MKKSEVIKAFAEEIKMKRLDMSIDIYTLYFDFASSYDPKGNHTAYNLINLLKKEGVEL